MDRAIASLTSFEALARQAVTQAVSLAGAGCVLVDATAGNGHDTVFLARLALPEGGEVVAFDIQAQALEGVQDRLTQEDLHATLVCASHVELREHVPGDVTAIMFNLGFLPGSDKAVVTRKDSTLAALEAAADLLAVHGVLSVHAYSGHPGGKEEVEAVAAWVRALPRKHWRAQAVSEANRSEKAEFLWLMEKVA